MDKKKCEHLERVLAYVVVGHHDQYRKNEFKGLRIPYAIHPIQVMKHLWDWGVHDQDILEAALTHDILEDTNISKDKLEDIVGKIAVDYVVELTYHRSQGPKKIYMSSFKDKSIEAVVIKLADRIVNIKDFVIAKDNRANSYSKEAKNLFELIYSRKNEIIENFGMEVWHNIHNDYAKVLTQVGG